MSTKLYPAAALLGFVVLWEVVTRALAVPTYLLPPPSAIVVKMASQWNLLLQHGAMTTLEVILGFLLAAAVGFPLAVLIVYSRVFEQTMYPLLVSAQSIPKVAIAPLFIVWFGFGLAPKLMVAFLVAFFPIVVDSVTGLRSTPPEMLHLVRSMGASQWQAFWWIRLPLALPSILGGLKVAVTLAVVGAVVGEFVGSDRGLGYLIQAAIGTLDTTMIFAAVVWLAVIGMGAFYIIDLAEHRLLEWHVSQRSQQVYDSAEGRGGRWGGGQGEGEPSLEGVARGGSGAGPSG